MVKKLPYNKWNPPYNKYDLENVVFRIYLCVNTKNHEKTICTNRLYLFFHIL